MKTKLAVSSIVFGLIILTFTILLREPVLMDSQELRSPDILFSSYSSNGRFRFNPETILSALNRGETAVFTSIPNLSETQKYSTPFPWNQSDYIKLVRALHQFMWHESIEGWHLHAMFFDGECNYDPIGFDNVRVSYYKPTGLQQYDAHLIGIYPLSGEGEWGAGSNYPRSLFGRWKNIDTEEVKITVIEALNIAEDNGGKQARLSVENMCRIHTSLGPYPALNWQVFYSNRNARTIFEIKIDAKTGDYEILTVR